MFRRLVGNTLAKFSLAAFALLLLETAALAQSPCATCTLPIFSNVTEVKRCKSAFDGCGGRCLILSLEIDIRPRCQRPEAL